MLRIGHGYDVHAFAEGRRLVLGGVEIAHTRGLAGHSDADVLTHALMDALLGAMREGDIGQLFPDTDPAYEGADSLVLLGHVASLARARGFAILDVDCTVAGIASVPYSNSPQRRCRRWRPSATTGFPPNVSGTKTSRLSPRNIRAFAPSSPSSDQRKSPVMWRRRWSWSSQRNRCVLNSPSTGRAWDFSDIILLPCATVFVIPPEILTVLQDISTGTPTVPP